MTVEQASGENPTRPADERPTPNVFISYSWDSDDHLGWVRTLAERLTNNGVSVFLDQWHVGPGDSITRFMEEKVSTCDHVIIVCTPKYAQRSMKRQGGVGYEQQIISGRIAAGIERKKFIPVVRYGTFEPGDNCAVPPHFMGIFGIDMRSDEDIDTGLERLLRAIFDKPKFVPPPIGPKPIFSAEEESDGDDLNELLAKLEPVGRLPRLELDGWAFTNGKDLAAQYPETFHIPSSESRSHVPIGHFVKLGFEVMEYDPEHPDDFFPAGERMWAKVIGYDGPYVVGVWANESISATSVPALGWGRPVSFLPEHIIDIVNPKEMEMNADKKEEAN